MISDDDERRRYGDNSILEPIAEQQDDEVISSPMSQSSSTDRNFLEEQRERDREEIEKFEALERELASNRHGIRVKFAHSVAENEHGDEQSVPMKQTMVLKTEPCFQIQSTEDQIAKHFYENSLPRNCTSKTPSEQDSLEEEMNRRKIDKNHTFEPISSLSSPSSSSAMSPTKSILKKSSKHEEILNKNRSRTPSPSPSSSRKRPLSSNTLASNEFPYLAELTAKQRNPSTTFPVRSLFEPTINIFDSSSSTNCPVNSIRRRPSRLRYYIKPYRGEAPVPSEKNVKERPRSLSSEKRIEHQPETTARWHTFSSRYGRPMESTSTPNRKQHVSWSPVREYIHQGRDKPTPSINKKTPSLSSSNPCLPSAATISTPSSMIPISVRYRSTRLTTVPQHFRQSFPPTLMDSYETRSVPDPSLTPITPLSQVSQYEEKEERVKVSSLPDVVYPRKKNHDETMARYDRLLEKMRTTDEQLQQLSRSWDNHTTAKLSMPTHPVVSQPSAPPPAPSSSSSSLQSKRITTTDESLLSPRILQMCFFILLFLNLIVLYFFNDINYWWSRYVNYAVVLQQHERSTAHIS